MTSTIEELKENFLSFGVTIKEEELLSEIIPLCSEYDLDLDTITQKFIAFNLNKKLENILHRKSIDLFKLHLAESNSSSTSKPAKKKVLKEQNDEISINDTSNFNFLNSYCDTSVLSNIGEKNPDEKANVLNSSNISFSNDTSLSTASSSWPKGVAISLTESPVVNFDIDRFEDSDTLRRENPQDKNEIIKRWSENVRTDIINSVDLNEIKNSCTPQEVNASLSQILAENREEESGLTFKSFDEKIYQDALYFGKVINLSRNVNNHAKKPPITEKNPCKKVMGFMDIDEDLGSFQHTKLSQSQIGLAPFTTAIPVRFEIAAEDVPVSVILGEPVVFVGTNPSKQNVLVKRQLQLENIQLDSFVSLDSLIFIASGPFQRYDKAVEDSSIVDKVAKAIVEKRPSLVLINGPIIDSNHPRMLDYVKGTFDELFVKFRNLFIKAALDVEAKIIFISSYKEFGQRPIYPTQPNLQTRGISKEVLGSRVFFAPDPCFLTLSSSKTMEKGPKLVISSTDVIMHLSGEETSMGSDKTKPEMDRISRICKKIISTGSMYPMNPCNFDVPMNYSLWNVNCNFKPVKTSRHHDNRSAPHCFIMPSFINFSTKIIDNALFLNSGLASRLYGDGCYTLLQTKASENPINSLKDHLIMNNFKL